MSAAVLEAVDTVVCPNPQKRAYKSKARASRAAVHVTALFPQQGRKICYPCVCSAYHLTTTGPRRA